MGWMGLVLGVEWGLVSGGGGMHLNPYEVSLCKH